MNIYLDIDGVLLANEHYASPFADEFIAAVLKKYPESTYWLSTHCWRGVNETKEVLQGALREETMALLPKIKETDWGDFKTDAIDFSQPFLWFDDELYAEERQALIENLAIERHVGVDIYNEPEMLKKLIEKFFK